MTSLNLFELKTLTGMVILLASCTPSPAPESPSSPLGPTLPLRIVVLLDKSRSTVATRTPQVGLDDVAPLIETVAQMGGELAVGVISDRDYERRHGLPQSLLRLRIEPPPRRPTQLGAAGNPIAALEQRTRLAEEAAAFQPKKKTWEQAVQEARRVFRDNLESILNAPANAQRTDVVSALMRANLFLNEPGSEGSKKWLLCVGDGLHDATEEEQSPPLSSSPGLAVVNGAGSTGMFAQFEPLRFESFEAATQYIVKEVVDAASLPGSNEPGKR